jgi:hypothetical protein
MAKRIQILDSATWRTFPGNKGELSREGASLRDTVFGQTFDSNMTGLINWSINTNGIFKGFAGYLAKIMKSGSSTATTAEAMTLVSGKTFQLNSAAHRVLDRAVMPTFTDNGVAVPGGDILSIDYLNGTVTFTSGHTVTGPIIMATGSYLPMTQVGRANGFTLTQTANAIDDTDFETAQGNDGKQVFIPGLRTVALSLKGIHSAANAFGDLLDARQEMIIEIDPAGNGKSFARGWFRAMGTGQSGDVGEQEEENINFSLAVPDDEDIALAFSWFHASDTTLSRAIRVALDAWEDEELVEVNYLENGTTGVQGEAVITDISLTGGLEAMNEFSVKFQGSGALTPFP